MLLTIPPFLGIALVLGALSVALGVFRWQQVKGTLSDEGARKGVHVTMGALTLAFPWLFSEPWPVLLLAALALVAMLALRVGPLRRSVGDVLHGVQRESVGDLAFPVAVAILFVLTGEEPVFYAIPLLLLALADPAAALVGSSYGRVSYRTVDGRKSREGSIAFVAVAFMCVHVPLLLWGGVGRLESLLIAGVVTVLVTKLEAVAWRGLDNLFVPVGAYAVLVNLVPLPPVVLAAHLGVALGLFVLAVRLRRWTTLSGGAVVGAALVAYVTWAVGGTVWLIAPALVYVLYTRLWWAPTSEKDAERPHTVHSVFSVVSVGVAWLLAAWILDRPMLIVAYAAAYAGSFAIIGAERLGERRPGWTSRRAAVQRTLLSAAPSAALQAAGVLVAFWIMGWPAPFFASGLAFLAAALCAGLSAWAVSRFGHVVDGTERYTFAGRARRAAVVGASSSVGLLALPLLS